MDIAVALAKDKLPELIRAVEDGEEIIITRHGKAVAQLIPAPSNRRRVQWGAMRNRVKFLPGWDDSIDLDGFLAGDL